MTPHATFGFASELDKIAGLGSMLGKLLRAGEESGVGRSVKALFKDIKESPEHRRAIFHSAALGGITGGAAGLAGGGDEPAWKRGLRGATGGAAGGAITGALFPAWFTGDNRRIV